MKNFKNKPGYLSVLLFSMMLASCATITVNVYFPAEEVKQAYTNLEEEFLLDDIESPPADTSPQATPPGSSIRELYRDEPTITVKKVVPLSGNMDFDLINKAFAQENIARTIEVELKKMPNVVKAFQSRASRKDKIYAMLSSGIVGEGNNGLLVERGNLSAADKSLMSAENADRKTIINGMTIAILKLNNLDNNPENNKKVYPEAAEQFAATRRDASNSGWSVQLPNGKWATKR